MILLIFLYFTVVYPFLIYSYFTYNSIPLKNILNLKDTTKDINVEQPIYNIYISAITSESFVNPYIDTKYNLKLTFDNVLNDIYLKVIDEKLLLCNNASYVENILKIDIDVDNNLQLYFHAIIELVKKIYPTYCRINFIYHEKTYFISELIKTSIDEINNDNTRNYFMINIYLLGLKLANNIEKKYNNELKQYSELTQYNESLINLYLEYTTAACDKYININNLYYELL